MARITVADTDVEGSARAGETVLAALVRNGYGYRVGCRRGGCGVCKVELLSGTVEYPVTVAESVLPADEREHGRCLTCRAVPTSDLVVRMLDDDKLRCVAPLLASLARAGARSA